MKLTATFYFTVQFIKYAKSMSSAFSLSQVLQHLQMFLIRIENAVLDKIYMQ